MIDSKKAGMYIAELRKERNMTQADLASLLGVTFQAVSKWEKGFTFPDLELLYRMAGYFGVSMEELVNGEARHKENLTYTKAGVNIGLTDSIKSMHLGDPGYIQSNEIKGDCS